MRFLMVYIEQMRMGLKKTLFKANASAWNNVFIKHTESEFYSFNLSVGMFLCLTLDIRNMQMVKKKMS